MATKNGGNSDVELSKKKDALDTYHMLRAACLLHRKKWLKVGKITDDSEKQTMKIHVQCAHKNKACKQ